MTKRVTYVETLTFMFGVVVSLAAILYLGRGVSDELGKDPKAVKYLELISTCQYVAAILLILAFALFLLAKLSLFGYERVMEIDPIEIDHHEQHQIEQEIESEKEMTNIIRTEVLRNRINEQLKEKKSASFRLAREDIGPEDEITSAAREMEALLAERMERTRPKPQMVHQGISRLPLNLQRLLRTCLFLGALCCLLATIFGCISLFFSFIFKVTHASTAIRFVFACALSLIGVVVVLGNALVMHTARVHD